jgi:hypothetical protein
MYKSLLYNGENKDTYTSNKQDLSMPLNTTAISKKKRSKTMLKQIQLVTDVIKHVIKNDVRICSLH